MPDGSVEARSRRRRTLRRIGVVIAVALIACAVVLFNGITVSSNGKTEWLNGHRDTDSLIVPLILFVLGTTGLAVCLAGPTS